MPYRRLPNTDSARMRAMQKALHIAEKFAPYQLAYSVSTYQELKYFYPEFKQNIEYQKETLERQTDKSKVHHNFQKKARLYISHFIQVLNFSIARGELKANARDYFGLEEYENRLPNLNTETEIISWGEKLIAGEQQRLSFGNSPITNPTIARVKVHYEEFLREYRNHKHLQETHNKAIKKIAPLREKSDAIILKLWNEIENTYSDLEPDEKRQKASEYGITYVYRKHEKLSFQNLKFDRVK